MTSDTKIGLTIAGIGLLVVGAGAGVGALVGGKKHRTAGAITGGLITASGVALAFVPVHRKISA